MTQSVQETHQQRQARSWRDLFRFRNYSLRTKLIIAFVALAVIVVGGVTLAAQQAIRDALTQTVAQNLKARAQTTALAIALAFDRNVDRLETLTFDEQLQASAAQQTDSYPKNEADRANLIRIQGERWGQSNPNDQLVSNVMHGPLAYALGKFGSIFPANEEMFVTDAYGSLIAATDKQPQFNFANNLWWQVAYNLGKGSVYIGQPEFNSMSNAYGIRIAVPIYDIARTRVVGILHSFFSLNALHRTFLLSQYGQPGNVDLVFPQGQILTSEGDFRVLPPDQTTQVRDGINFPLTMVNYRGEPLLSSQAVVGASDTQPEPYLRSSAWRTIATITPLEALGVIDAASRAALIAGLLAVLAAILAAILLAQFLTRPILHLTTVAQQVQGGDLAARAPVETRDEIGTLASTFNSMTARLQETLAGLEQRVAERTHELSQANLQLQSNSAYLSALSDTSTGLFERLNLNDLLQAIVERAGALLDTQNGFIFFAEPGESDIQMRVGTGLYDDLVGTHAQPGVGLAGTVWQTGQPMVIEDYQQWEGRLPGSRRDALRAIVGVPLTRGSEGNSGAGETVGVIGLAYTDGERKFGTTEVEILQRFAQLASIALDNARLYASSESRVQELAALNSVSQIVTQETELEPLVEKIGDEVHRIFSSDFTYIALYDAESDSLEFLYVMEGGKRSTLPPLARNEGATWQAVNNRQPLLLTNVSQAEYMHRGAVGASHAEEPSALLAVPLFSGERALGVIGIQWIGLGRSFTPDEQRLLTTIAASAAVGIENARLAQATRQALAETQRLAARERESAEQLLALNRRLTREGWRDYLEQLQSSIVVEAGERDDGGNNGKVNGDGKANGSNGNGKIQVPISLRGEVIGEIELEPDDSDRATANDLGLVTHVAENIALALDNARLYSETQRRVTELDALNRISQAVSSELELDTLLNIIGDQLRTIFAVDNVYIALYDRITRMISLPYFVNDNQRLTVDPIPFGEGITSHIIRTREPLVINKQSEQRMAQLGARVVGNPARSYLGVPVLVGDDIIGVISIQSIEREGMFDESNVRLLETIAASVGAAIQNAQLYGAMQREVLVRQRAEEEIKLSLKEKEVLLKEIHHRVKNNLQIISSLLNLQSAQLQDAGAYGLFRESQARVRSMALIHEKLYQSKDLARIDFDGYVRDLMVYLFRSYAANPDQIHTVIDTSDMYLGIDTAIPCG
ncbi:MAG TPA: GAF domain-containing protein, partial [Anaerolineae bacterium]|nr:GAF domain-containing protein [Anaerolineae bacterium]